MPADPTARDVETARAIMASYREAPMWWSTERAVDMATDAIAAALATARAEEREAIAVMVEDAMTGRIEVQWGAKLALPTAAKMLAAAIRAREGTGDGK